MSRTATALSLALLLPSCTGRVGTLPKGDDTAGAISLNALEVDRVVPAVGPVEGGTSITVTGAGFTDTVSLTIGSMPCVALSVVSTVELACTTPAQGVGEYALTVSRPDDGAFASVTFAYEGDGGTGGGASGDEGGGTGGEEGGGTGAGTAGGEGGGTGGTGGTTTPVDYCHLQFPCSMSGVAATTSDVTYVWVYQGGVTEGVGQGAGLTVEVGVGPDASNPASGGWVWSSAAYNADKDGLSPLANDEYGGTFAFPAAAGDYDYCGRVSADGGSSWTYCDGGGSDCSGRGTDDGYSAAEAGHLSVYP